MSDAEKGGRRSIFEMLAAMLAVLIPTSLFLGVAPRGAGEGPKASGVSNSVKAAAEADLKFDPRSVVLESMGLTAKEAGLEVAPSPSKGGAFRIDFGGSALQGEWTPPGAREATESAERAAAREVRFPFHPEWHLDFVVASLTDPLDSRLGFYFDGALAVVEQAAVDSGYLLDRWRLPWSDEIKGAPRRLHRDVPGVLVFRKRGSASASTSDPRRLLVVFLVGETPTSGLHDGALVKALHYIESYRVQAGAAQAHESHLRTIHRTDLLADLYVAAPNYTGGAMSLSRALGRWRRERVSLLPSPPPPWGAPPDFQRLVDVGSWRSNLEAPTIRLFSTGATAVTRAALEGWCLRNHVKATYETPLDEDDQALDCLLQHVCEQEKRRPWPVDRIASAISIPPPIVLLRESNTAFGAAVGRAASGRGPANEEKLEHWLNVKSIGFPQHIAAVRFAYQPSANSGRDALARFEPPRARLDLSAEAPLEQTERPTVFAPPLASAEAEANLHDVLAFVERSQARYVGVVATDVRDRIFIAQLVRERLPNVQMLLPQADLFYLNRSANRFLRGALVASSYPMTPELDPGSDPTKLLRSRRSDGDFGRYHSIRRAIQHATDAVPLAWSPQWRRDDRRIWISSVGADRMWPVANRRPTPSSPSSAAAGAGRSSTADVFKAVPWLGPLLAAHAEYSSEIEAATVTMRLRAIAPPPTRWIAWGVWLAMLAVAARFAGRLDCAAEKSGEASQWDHPILRQFTMLLLFLPPTWLACWWIAAFGWREVGRDLIYIRVMSVTILAAIPLAIYCVWKSDDAPFQKWCREKAATYLCKIMAYVVRSARDLEARLAWLLRRPAKAGEENCRPPTAPASGRPQGDTSVDRKRGGRDLAIEKHEEAALTGAISELKVGPQQQVVRSARKKPRNIGLWLSWVVKLLFRGPRESGEEKVKVEALEGGRPEGENCVREKSKAMKPDDGRTHCEKLEDERLPVGLTEDARLRIAVGAVALFPFVGAICVYRPSSAEFSEAFGYWRFTSLGIGVSAAEPLFCLGWAMLACGWCRRAFGHRLCKIEDSESASQGGDLEPHAGTAVKASGSPDEPLRFDEFLLLLVGVGLAASLFGCFAAVFVEVADAEGLSSGWLAVGSATARMAANICFLIGCGGLVGINVADFMWPKPSTTAEKETSEITPANQADARKPAARIEGRTAVAQTDAATPEGENDEDELMRAQEAASTKLKGFLGPASPVPRLQAQVAALLFTSAVGGLLWMPYMPTIDGALFDYAFLSGFTIVSALLLGSALRFYYYWSLVRDVLRSVEGMPWSAAFERLPARAKRYFGRLLMVDPAEEALIGIRLRLEEECGSLKPNSAPSETPELGSRPLTPPAAKKLNETFRWLLNPPLPAARMDDEVVLPAPEGCRFERVAEKGRPSPAALHRTKVEDYAAVAFIEWINPYLAALRPLFNGVAIASVLLIAAAASYPFPSGRAVMGAAGLVVFAAAALALSVLWQMETDALLSRANGTQPGELTFDFKLLRAISTALLPVLALAAVAFPEFGRAVALWLEPWIGSN